ncbi:MAG: nucleotidyl transferase AbiEii/AbiGii toxin family protein [Planctomycetes bacterium]|nr:nucleotidyl transferase AbiEii/AbiGii toxin family protein [Planctomycetota bacterium]
MPFPEPALLEFFQRIDAVDLPCFIGGSVATTFFGEPRLTLDIDLVVAAGEADAERLMSAFPEERYYRPPLETVRRELQRGAAGGFNVIDERTGLKADIYPSGDDPLNAYGFAHALARDAGTARVLVASPTYSVARKLRWFAMSGQDKHLRDIRGLLASVPERIDHAVVEEWAADAGVLEAWRACLRRIGEE